MEHFELIDELALIGVNINTQKAEIKINSTMGSNHQVILVSPLNCQCDAMRWQDEAERDAITWAIDIDKWQHSWHNEIKPENYEHFLEIIQGKIAEKAELLVKLNAVSIFLANKIKQLQQSNPELLIKQIKPNKVDDLPF